MKNSTTKYKRSAFDEHGRRDIAASSAYGALAKVLFKELHYRLYQKVFNFLREKYGQRGILIIGPGAEVLPYSYNTNEFREILSGSNIAFMDYNESILQSASRIIRDNGFKEYLIINARNSDCIHLNCDKDKIFLIEQNVAEPFPLKNNSVSCIETTLAIHHATIYRDFLVNIAREMYRVLESGGFLHYGTGNVTMRYSEQKLIDIVHKIIRSSGNTVQLIDERNAPNNIYRKQYRGNDNLTIEMVIDKEGVIHITGNPQVNINLFNKFREDGFKTIDTNSSQLKITIPLIDPLITKDFQGLIIPVRKYYLSIISELERDMPLRFKNDVINAVKIEMNNAERGVVEYYTHPDEIASILKEVGFCNIQKDYTKNKIFCSITAHKK